jgi:peptidoglycan/LPS O-acetylase OafA/YrhL
MIALFIVALAAVVLFAASGWHQPQKPITTAVDRTQRIDSNVAQLFDSPPFQHFAFEAENAASYESARQGLAPAQLSGFLHDTTLDLDPETLRSALALPVMLSHTWERPLLADGDCPTCETKPWAGRYGTLIPVDRNEQLLLDHLRQLQQG